MKMNGGNGGIAHRPFYFPGNFPLCSLSRNLVMSQIRCGGLQGTRNILSLSGIEPRFLGRTAHSLLTIMTEILRLLCCRLHRLHNAELQHDSEGHLTSHAVFWDVTPCSPVERYKAPRRYNHSFKT
jgi:hypothetical protein